jgi:glycogen operon protein
MLLNGLAIDEVDARGEPITDDLLLLLINGHDQGQPFTLPGPRTLLHWEVLLDTHRPEHTAGRTVRPGGIIKLQPRTLVVLRLPQEQLRPGTLDMSEFSTGHLETSLPLVCLEEI